MRLKKKKKKTTTEDFPGGTVVKNLPSKAGDTGSISWLGRSPAEGNGNPLQYSYLGNPTDRGAWWSTVHGVTKSQTRLSDETTPNKPTDSEDEQTQTGQA